MNYCFRLAWQAYPEDRKRNREECAKQFKSAVALGAKPNDIVRAIEDLQNKPVEKGEEQLRILKEQLVEFNVQLKTPNTIIAIIVSEPTKNHDCSLKHIDSLSETLQLEAAKRANLRIDRISNIRGKNWNWYTFRRRSRKSRNEDKLAGTSGDNLGVPTNQIVGK